MPIPLSYQISEYDCGPVCLLNALNVLFDRKLLPPCLIKAIYQYSLDCVDNQGRLGKRGTSACAIRFLSSWLNDYSRSCNFPIRCESLPSSEIRFEEGNHLMRALENGGVAIIRCRLGVPHYVLVTGAADGWVQMWDPYHIEIPIRKKSIRMVEDHPYRYNRLVTYEQVNSTGKGYYSLGEIDTRECTLFFNTNTSAEFLGLEPQTI